MSVIPTIPPTTADKDLIRAINNRIEKINQALLAAPTTTPSGNVVAITDQPLTIPTTQLYAPADGSSVWVVIVRQDTTGGRAIQWAGKNITGASTNIDTTPGTISAFVFVKSNLSYVMVAQPTTGMTP